MKCHLHRKLIFISPYHSWGGEVFKKYGLLGIGVKYQDLYRKLMFGNLHLIGKGWSS